ncbi:hypothetical protein OG395_04570 [Streptomyces sp. NBC_01320]|nr:hypothetical protein OG395_04570 [Streptomyces sp. NBC_01320]
MDLHPWGIAAVARLAEVSESTIVRGRDELAGGASVLERVRRPGGGRRPAAERAPRLLPAHGHFTERHPHGRGLAPARVAEHTHRALRRHRPPDRIEH